MKSTVIKCFGKKNGADCWFIWCRGGHYLASDSNFNSELLEIHSKTTSIGGTYFLTPDDPLVAVGVANEFFDEFTLLQCNGEAPKLPSEPGVIY